MSRSHVHAHAQVVGALSGHAPRSSAPHIAVTHQQYSDANRASQINQPRRAAAKSNFRDRSNRRRTTGFEEIRQEYFQTHQNRATAQPAEEGSAVHHRAANDPDEFFPKPSAFIKAPRRTLLGSRPIETVQDDTELFDGGGFRTRGSKAADLFQRRRERTDQFITEEQDINKAPHPLMPSNRATIVMTQLQQGHGAQQTQGEWEPAARQPVRAPNAPPPQQAPRVTYQQASNQPPRRATTPTRQEPAYHTQQHQQPAQQQYQQQQQPQHSQQQQASAQTHRSNPTHQSQQRGGHTTVDSRRARKPLAPANRPRIDQSSSPWNDRNMDPGKRFHPSVTPYQDSYNASPKGWGGPSSESGHHDNNVKYQYTATTEKFRFTPATRINKYSSGLGTPSANNYNSRPKSWGDIENCAPRASRSAPSRRAYPAPQRQSRESSANQFSGPSGRGYGESDEL